VVGSERAWGGGGGGGPARCRKTGWWVGGLTGIGDANLPTGAKEQNPAGVTREMTMFASQARHRLPLNRGFSTRTLCRLRGYDDNNNVPRRTAIVSRIF
jgi:hypothetical protein